MREREWENNNKNNKELSNQLKFLWFCFSCIILSNIETWLYIVYFGSIYLYFAIKYFPKPYKTYSI